MIRNIIVVMILFSITIGQKIEYDKDKDIFIFNGEIYA